MTAVRAALVQWHPGENPAENLAQVGEFLSRASDADLVVLPEYSQHLSRSLRDTAEAAAEPIDGQFVQGLCDYSREFDLTAVAGMIERDGDDVFNTVVVAQAGAMVTRYRKVHLYDSFGGGESEWCAAGEPQQLPLFAVAGLTVGIQTCYDLRFPEVTRRLAHAGAAAVLCPADWVGGPGKEHHWSTLVTARAIENTVYLLAPDVPPPLGVGHSMIVDPRGIAIAAAGSDAETIVRAEVDPDVVATVREGNPSLRLARYGIAEP